MKEQNISTRQIITTLDNVYSLLPANSCIAKILLWSQNVPILTQSILQQQDSKVSWQGIQKVFKYFTLISPRIVAMWILQPPFHR